MERRVCGMVLAVLTTPVVFAVALVVLAWFGRGPSLAPSRRGARSLRPYLLLGTALGIAPFDLFGPYVVGYELLAAAQRGPGNSSRGEERPPDPATRHLPLTGTR